MDNDINTLWALVSSSLLFVASAAIVLMVEGSSRRRTVSSGAAKHLVSAAGAILGVVATGFAVRNGAGEWLDPDGLFLGDVTLTNRVEPDATSTVASLLQLMAVSVVFATAVLAATVERATHTAHLVVGTLSGGLFVPLGQRATDPTGVLGSIDVGGDRFMDSGATTVFTMAAWFGLVGAMVIGPRLGRMGSAGQIRAIPGKSPLMVSLGAALFAISAIGFVTLARAEWTQTALDATVVLLVAGAVGSLVAAAIGFRRYGDVGTLITSRGAVAGVIAALGDPFAYSPFQAIIVGAVGAAFAVVVVMMIGHRKIDDPLGAVGVFGAAGLVGALAAGVRAGDQFVAQLVGQLIVAGFALVAAGIVFGALRVMRVLRISQEIEVVGLDS